MSEQHRRQNKRTGTHRVKVPAEVVPLLEQIGRLAQQQGVRAYAVGGCVRDWALGIPTARDLDLAVEGDGIAFAKQVAGALGGSVTAHQQFGTATLQLRRLRIDMATCRKETYAAPAAYPKVTAGRLRDDLFRRDFTVNAMAMAIAPSAFGRLVDPFKGMADLKAKRLRILHAKSFVDDPSRILRAVRFAQRYRLAVEPRTRRALRQALAAGMLQRLNRGRWRKEFERMTQEPHPLACLSLLAQWVRG